MLTHEQKNRIGFTYVLNQIRPASPYGRDALRSTQAACPGQEEVLRKELQNIAKTLKTLPQAQAAYAKLEQVFRQTKDIRSSIKRIGGQLSEIDLFEIKQFTLQLEEIAPAFDEINKSAKYHGIAIEGMGPALAILDPEESKVASFHISSRSFPLLAELREEKKSIERKLRLTPDGKKKAELLSQRSEVTAREQKEELEAALWLSKELKPWQDHLLQNTEAIGRMDLTMQKAKLASAGDACMPEITGEGISFTSMSNPQMENTLAEAGGQFTPLSLELKAGTTVITGANMGGKSVALKTLALNVLLIHCGFYPFAKKANCPLLDGIHMISDDLEAADRGLSSFGGEIVKLQEVLSEVREGKALMLLDEFARGTNPSEGGAIARGVCAYMSKQKAVTVMTTHYEGVAALAGAHYQVAGLRKIKDHQALSGELASTPVGERVAKIAGYMDYGLLHICAGEKLPKDAINICRMLGLQDEIISLINGQLE
ncbi:MAG: hypothetical protein FWB97_06865 [Oscillospiraceae bacterium]|nr:hypothetical protein [Oscillospiraceae bacterium]